MHSRACVPPWIRSEAQNAPATVVADVRAARHGPGLEATVLLCLVRCVVVKLTSRIELTLGEARLMSPRASLRRLKECFAVTGLLSINHWLRFSSNMEQACRCATANTWPLISGTAAFRASYS